MEAQRLGTSNWPKIGEHGERSINNYENQIFNRTIWQPKHFKNQQNEKNCETRALHTSPFLLNN